MLTVIEYLPSGTARNCFKYMTLTVTLNNRGEKTLQILDHLGDVQVIFEKGFCSLPNNDFHITYKQKHSLQIITWNKRIQSCVYYPIDVYLFFFHSQVVGYYLTDVYVTCWFLHQKCILVVSVCTEGVMNNVKFKLNGLLP